MTFDDIQAGSTVFVDSNTLIFHFAAHLKFGAASTRLINRIERGDIRGVCSTHVLAEVAHRLMTLEAINQHGWPPNSIAARLKKNHRVISSLCAYQVALSRLPQTGMQVIPLFEHTLIAAVHLSAQFGLLTNDAIVVAMMREQGIAQLASHDSDYDRVSGITRFAPA
jgi:predicted nucleic acid-binding protein